MPDVSLTPVQNAINAINDPNRIPEYLERFQIRDKVHIPALRLLADSTPLLFDKSELDREFACVTDPSQDVQVDLFQDFDPTIFGDLIDSGYECGSTVRVTIGRQNLISVKLCLDKSDYNRIYKWCEGNGVSGEDILQVMYNYLVTKGFEAMLQAMETQALTWLDSIKHVGGGVGTRYTADVNDYKRIPLAEEDKALLGIDEDGVFSNYFDDNGTPQLIGGSGFRYNWMSNMLHGASNDVNLAKQNEMFTPYFSRAIGVTDPVNDSWRSFLVARGGVGMTTWVYDYVPGVQDWLKTSDKMFEVAQIPNIAKGGDTPPINVGIISNVRDIDNFAVHAHEYARHDTGLRIMMYAEPVFVSAYSPVAGESPVIGYIQDKV